MPVRTLAVIAALAGAGLPAVQAPSTEAVALESVITRAGAYVVAYRQNFIGVVAEERYRQDSVAKTTFDTRGLAREGDSVRRDTRADVLLVQTPGSDQWVEFRDVFEVDGRAVRDRADRLTKLFLQPMTVARSQLEAITEESARYNIGTISRNFNVPMLALTVVDPEHKGRFSFHGSPKKDNAPRDLWVIDYREQRARTIIRGASGEDMPLQGHLTIEALTGRVVATELVAESDKLRGQIEVTYADEPSIGILAPREMKEKYTAGSSTVTGRATYSNFRRFQVSTDEKLKK